MTNDEVRDLKSGDKITIFRTPYPSVVVVVDRIVERGKCQAESYGAYGAMWAVVRDGAGDAHIVESDEYIQGFGEPTHKESNCMGAAVRMRINGVEK